MRQLRNNWIEEWLGRPDERFGRVWQWDGVPVPRVLHSRELAPTDRRKPQTRVGQHRHCLAHTARNAPAPPVLHGTDREVVRGRKADEMLRLLLDQQALDAVAPELDGQEQPDRSSPNNDDGNLLAVRSTIHRPITPGGPIVSAHAKDVVWRASLHHPQ